MYVLAHVHTFVCVCVCALRVCAHVRLFMHVRASVRAHSVNSHVHMPVQLLASQLLIFCCHPCLQKQLCIRG